jgi:DNA-binding CsgD family transcriptional regulator
MSGASAWPLVGRRTELERLADARASESVGVVLVGPAGVGKSRLARAAVDAARDDGTHTFWVQATRSAAAVPLGAFAGLLPAEVRSDEPLELLRRGVESLREAADGRPVVLGVDDAQLLDPISAALVQQVAVTGTAFVVATVRTGEPCPDAIVALWKDNGARRVELGLLTADEAGDLAEAIVGGALEQAARQWAWSTSRGNALYVRELVGSALTSGALVEADELWRLRVRPPLADSLAELIVGRIGDLDGDARSVVELLAIGEPLTAAELIALTDEDALILAEEHGLIVATEPDAVRLAHPLYGEVVAAALGAIRLRRLRLRLAETLMARDERSPEDALRIAGWLTDAGEPVDPALLVEAARAANLAGDPDLGARFATLAIDGGAGTEAVLLLGRAHAVRKRYDEAERTLAPLEGRLTDQDVAATYLEQRAISVLYWGLQRADDADALLRRAQDWWSDQAWQRRLDPLRLQLAMLTGGFDATVDVSAEILSDPELSPELRHQLDPVHAVTLFYAGRVSEAFELACRIRPTVPLRDQSDATALVSLTISGLESGDDFDRLDRYMKQIFADGVRASDHEAAALAAMTVGAIRYLGGGYHDARRWLAESAAHLEIQDAFNSVIALRSTQVVVLQGTGDHEAVATAIARCRELPAWSDPTPSLAPYVFRAEGWAALAAGDPPGAQQRFLDGATKINNMRPYAALLLHEALRAGAPASVVVERQRDLMGDCDGRMCVAYRRHAEALAAGDGQAVLDVSAEFEAIGARRYAMESAASAAGLFVAGGRTDSARRAATRARELHDPGQGGTPPRLDGLDPVAATLTKREAQLVELARRNLSNVEIADRLVLSVRTVESHLYRAMQKLGISDRREL